MVRLKNQDPVAAVVVPIVFAIIFIVGIVGNGTLIFTVLRNKKLRNVPNIHILSLALGDLLLILISVPVTSTIYIYDWIFGTGLCKFNYFMQTLSLGVSIFTLVALSGDRYRVIVRPMSRHTGNPNRWTYLTAGFIWLLSIFLAVPDMISATDLVMKDRNNANVTVIVCSLYNRNWPEWYRSAHVITHFCIYFALPLFLIGFFYIMMARVLMVSNNIIPGDNSQQRQIEARKKVAKVVLSFVIIFIICWFPRRIYLMWYYFDPNDFNDFWHFFKIAAFCLYFINSCVNPMALYFLSRQFRKHYNEYLFCWCTKRQYAAVDQTASMYNFNSTVRRTSTNTTMVHSQSMC